MRVIAIILITAMLAGCVGDEASPDSTPDEPNAGISQGPAGNSTADESMDDRDLATMTGYYESQLTGYNAAGISGVVVTPNCLKLTQIREITKGFVTMTWTPQVAAFAELTLVVSGQEKYEVQGTSPLELNLTDMRGDGTEMELLLAAMPTENSAQTQPFRMDFEFEFERTDSDVEMNPNMICALR